MYLAGLVLLFLSLFLEWYSFQMYDFSNDLVVSWSYYFFNGWRTPFSTSSTLNDIKRPDNALIPITINIVMIIAIILSGYVVLFKNIDQAVKIRSYYKYAYINGFLVLLVMYYLIICPIMYFIPNGLYFPLLNINDYDLEFIHLYAIGPGYILQLLAFSLVFPYSIFYFKTINTFIQQERTPEKMLVRQIANSQEPLDLDKYIAEEDLKQELNSQESENDTNNLITTFIEVKK
jgi:hypothetical protein